jgi:hypothetical protein
MVIGTKIVEKLKAHGVQDAEKVAYDIFSSLKEACVETAIDPAAEATEKGVCGVAAGVFASVDGIVKSALDFNKDGQLG